MNIKIITVLILDILVIGGLELDVIEYKSHTGIFLNFIIHFRNLQRVKCIIFLT